MLKRLPPILMPPSWLERISIKSLKNTLNRNVEARPPCLVPFLILIGSLNLSHHILRVDLQYQLYTSLQKISGTMSIIFVNKIERGIPSYAPSASRLHAKTALPL